MSEWSYIDEIVYRYIYPLLHKTLILILCVLTKANEYADKISLKIDYYIRNK